MKKDFARTGNVKNFISAMTRLDGRQEGIPGMGLVFSEPGLGKSRTCIWWCAQNDAVYVRAKAAMTVRWMLKEIVAELGEAPARNTEALFQQALGLIMERKRFIFIDEADYLARDPKMIDTVRDLHDMTGTPIVLLGMDMADKKFARYKPLYDRFSEIVKFNPLSEADIKSIAEQICDVKLSDDAIHHIHGQGNRFRRVVVQFYKAEAFARTNNRKEITAADLVAVKK